jgi:HlyD family secretion protein
MAQNLAPIGKRSVTGVQNEEDTNRSLLEFQSPTVALIAQPAPPFAHYSTYIIASMVVAFLIVAGTMPIDRVVTASGKVTTQSSNILVQPLETSIVRSIDVSVGQRVHTGDLLARLDPTFAGADQAAAMKLMVSLQAEVNRLTAEAAEKPYASDGTPDSQLQAAIFAQRQAERAYKIENYAQKISGLDVVYRKAQAEVGIYGERAGYADTLLRSRQDLERQGVGSKLNTLQAKDSAAEAHRLLDQSKAAAISAKRDLDAMIAERDGVIQQARGQTSQELSDAGRKLADAKEQLAKAQKRRQCIGRLRAQSCPAIPDTGSQ